MVESRFLSSYANRNVSTFAVFFYLFFQPFWTSELRYAPIIFVATMAETMSFPLSSGLQLSRRGWPFP
jgi:hypothetical protein